MAKQRKTRNPVIWLQYGCWHVATWMMFHKPYYPLRLRMFLLDRFDPERHHLSWDQVRFWSEIRPDYVHPWKPLPWWVGQAAVGPFVCPWNRVQRFFRRLTGGRSHRCEFTDPEMGALYGHRHGGFMNRWFEQFIENISVEQEDPDA